MIPVITVALVLAAATACTSTSNPESSSSTAASTPAVRPTTTTVTKVTAAPVPPSYRDLYHHLDAQLDAFAVGVNAIPTTAHGRRPIAATELLAANGNRLEALLKPQAMTSVDTMLDAFARLGITGVTLGIKLPMLLPRFGPHAAEYTAFYTEVAAHARARHMTVDVELGALFCGTAYAQCSRPFDGTYQQFVADTIAQSRIVIDRVKPDYLTILAEPTTEANLTGVKEFTTVDGTVRYVHDVLAGIGQRGHTKIGAGAATWLPSNYDAAILRESVDYLDVHVYPVNSGIAKTLANDTALAKRTHKPIVADEVWLYKTDNAAATNTATVNSIFRRDIYSFFTPLDERFLTTVVNWARMSGVQFVSAYWAGELFATLTWTPARDAKSFTALTQEFNGAVTQAILNGETTTLGRTYLSLFSKR